MKSQQTGNQGAIRATFEYHSFASQIELRTYKALRLYLSREEILVHHQIPIFDATPRFKKLGWNIDFYIPLLGMYVESKGCLQDLANREFKIKAHILERVNPGILNSLLVVSSEPGQPLWGNAHTIGIETMKRCVSESLKHVK